MKSLILIICLLFATVSYSQSVGIGTTNPNTTAALDVTSTTKGFLPPRMSFEQIIAIPSPAAGLMVFNTTFNKPAYFDGTNWRFFNDSIMKPKIGDNMFGGIVFYVDPTGKHGLVAAPIDQSTNTLWWNGSFVATGAISSSDGAANTTTIINAQGNTNSYAAKLCRDYKGGGYNDWFLPAKDQLLLLYAQRSRVGGFGQYFYWSSTEVDASMAVDVYFNVNAAESSNTVKNFPGDHVRAIRAF